MIDKRWVKNGYVSRHRRWFDTVQCELFYWCFYRWPIEQSLVAFTIKPRTYQGGQCRKALFLSSLNPHLMQMQTTSEPKAEPKNQTTLSLIFFEEISCEQNLDYFKNVSIFLVPLLLPPSFRMDEHFIVMSLVLRLHSTQNSDLPLSISLCLFIKRCL